MNASAAHATPPGPLLPTLPVVVARLIALYASDDYSVDHVLELLETDPPITARLLRLANSAYYGFEGRVDTPRRAVVLLGGAAVQAVALGATLLRPWASGAVPGEVEELWVHAFLTGVGCRYLARRTPPDAGGASPDGLFLAGLLRDVGKLVFLAQDPRRYGDLLRTGAAGEDLRASERGVFGKDHAEAGGDLLDSWSLPRWVAALVRHHHSGGLRSELRTGWAVMNAASAAARGVPAETTAGVLSPDLLGDLAAHLTDARPQAEAFYRSVS